MTTSRIAIACGVLGCGLAACGGATSTLNPSSGGGAVNPGVMNPPPTPAPVVTSVPTSTQQLISIALPTTAIGTTKDAVGDVIGGFTQQQFSQVLGFVPGAKVMLRNAQTDGTPHTLGDTGSASSFPANPSLSFQSNTANGGTLGSGFQSGTIASNTLVGPFVLAAGTYFIGCAFHYITNNMRDVLVVAANATPGPQATQAPNAVPPAPAPTGGGSNY